MRRPSRALGLSADAEGAGHELELGLVGQPDHVGCLRTLRGDADLRARVLLRDGARVARRKGDGSVGCGAVNEP